LLRFTFGALFDGDLLQKALVNSSWKLVHFGKAQQQAFFSLHSRRALAFYSCAYDIAEYHSGYFYIFEFKVLKRRNVNAMPIVLG